jgi:hypothetical protein
MKSKLYCTDLSHLTQLKIDVAGFFCSCLYDCEDLCGTLCCFQDFGSTKQSCGCQGVQLHPTFRFGSRVSIFLAMSDVFVDIYIYIYIFFDANHFDCRLEQLAFKWLAYSGFGKLHGWLPTSWEKQSPKRQHEATVLNTTLIFLITPSS